MNDRAPAPVDYVSLADAMRALGYPLRLELLEALRFPHTLTELTVPPHRETAGHRPTRAAKQTIHVHLGKLVDADLLRTERTSEEGHSVLRYQVNALKLYALTEELRRISTLHAGRGPFGDVTGTLGQPTHPDAMKGPRLVLVHGIYEGKAYPLDRTTSPDERWVIGRKRGLPVALDYDPFVSLENAVVTRQGTSFLLTDLPGSKNGTAVNWAVMPKGSSRPLKPGDVVGVGRSLLTFVPA